MDSPTTSTRLPLPISKFWIIGLLVLVYAVSIVAVVVKGFHLFSQDRDEPFIQGADDTHYLLWLRSWVIDGDIDFSNDVAETPFLEASAKEVILAEPLTETGLVKNKFPVGWAVLSVPLYLIADWIAPLTPWPADGFSQPYQIAIWLQQILIAGWGFYWLARILRRWFTTDICIVAITATWLCSPMTYYQSARISMVHNVVFVLGCLVFWLALKIKEYIESDQRYGKRYLLLLVTCAGFHAGLMVISRPTSVFYLLLPVGIILSAMVSHLRHRKGLFIAMILIAIISALFGVFPQLLAWKQLYGHWIYYSYQGEGFNWGSPQWYASLWSSHHGWFNWHPMLLIGIVVLLIASLKGKFPKLWILSAALIIWTNASWHMVYFGSAFGGRAYEFMGCFATLGLGFLLQSISSRPNLRHGLLTIYTLAAIWNAFFMYSFMQGLIPRELPVTWAERWSAIIGLFF